MGDRGWRRRRAEALQGRVGDGEEWQALGRLSWRQVVGAGQPACIAWPSQGAGAPQPQPGVGQADGRARAHCESRLGARVRCAAPRDGRVQGRLRVARGGALGQRQSAVGHPEASQPARTQHRPSHAAHSILGTPPRPQHAHAHAHTCTCTYRGSDAAETTGCATQLGLPATAVEPYRATR